MQRLRVDHMRNNLNPMQYSNMKHSCPDTVPLAAENLKILQESANAACIMPH